MRESTQGRQHGEEEAGGKTQRERLNKQDLEEKADRKALGTKKACGGRRRQKKGR